MKHPDALTITLLGLAAFRITRLVGWDDLTIRPRRWVTGIGDQEHHTLAHYIEEGEQTGEDRWAESWISTTTDPAGPPPISRRRFYLSKMIRCPWCVGFWISLAWAVAWFAAPWPTEVVSVPLAVSAIVGLVAKNLDP